MKYLMLKHYRGGPKPYGDDAQMDRWTPEEIDAHMTYMGDFARRLEGTGEWLELRPFLTAPPTVTE